MMLRSVIFLLVTGLVCGFTTNSLGRRAVNPTSLTRVEANRESGWDLPMPSQTIKAVVAGGVLAASLLVCNPLPVAAETSRIVGQFQGSGLVFKDTLQIESFDDPKIKGVTLYVSNFQRPLTERLTSNFLADPSDASVSCARTGPVVVADNIGRGKGGEEVFEESRSILFKSLRVRRVFDEEKKTVIYVSYNTRFDKNDDSNKSRFKSSLCAVSLEDYGKPDLPSSPAPP